MVSPKKKNAFISQVAEHNTENPIIFQDIQEKERGCFAYVLSKNVTGH